MSAAAALLFGTFVVGLLGTPHCAGMCGPLAVVLASTRPQAAAQRLGLFITGKALTYAVLGAAAGTFGAALGTPRLGHSGLAAVAIGAGTVMVVLGAGALHQRWRSRSSAAPSAVTVLLSRVLAHRGSTTPLAAGGLAGLLPCGLVYAMLAQAVAASSAAMGAAVMLTFGLGTAPSLLAAGWASRALGLRHRRLGEVVAALAVITMGVLAVARGVAVFAAADPSVAACPYHN